MKTKTLLAAAFCLLTAGLAAQTPGRQLDRSAKLALKTSLPVDRLFTGNHAGSTLKASSDLKQALNSMDYEGYIDSTASWITWYRNEWTYDSQGRELTDVWFDCNDESPGCTAQYRNEYAYDSAGNRTLASMFWYDSQQARWLNSGKEEFVFDSGRRMLSSTEFSFNDSSGLFVNEDKTEYTYNAAGQMIARINYNWDDSLAQWVNEGRSEYQYNAAGLEASELYFLWVAETAAWRQQMRSEYLYDNSGHVTRYETFRRDSATGELVSDYRNEMTYNVNGQLITSLELSWDPATSTWTETWRDEYTYDNLGNRIEDHGYYNKDSTGQWLYQFKEEFNYDNAFTTSQLLVPDYFLPSGYFNHKLINMIGSDWIDSTRQWHPDVRERLFWTEMNIGTVPNITLSKIRLFPNPVVDLIRLESDVPMEAGRIELIDAVGKRVLIQDLHGTRMEVSVGEIPRGIYLYRITGLGDDRLGKILVQ